VGAKCKLYKYKGWCGFSTNLTEQKAWYLQSGQGHQCISIKWITIKPGKEASERGAEMGNMYSTMWCESELSSLFQGSNFLFKVGVEVVDGRYLCTPSTLKHPSTCRLGEPGA
jgi:hypothetical protein